MQIFLTAAVPDHPGVAREVAWIDEGNGCSGVLPSIVCCENTGDSQRNDENATAKYSKHKVRPPKDSQDDANH